MKCNVKCTLSIAVSRDIVACSRISVSGQQGVVSRYVEVVEVVLLN